MMPFLDKNKAFLEKKIVRKGEHSCYRNENLHGYHGYHTQSNSNANDGNETMGNETTTSRYVKCMKLER